MILRVPNISDDAIERSAEALLAQYAHARGVEIRAPIPIDDVVVHLKLTLDFDDLARMFEIPDPEGGAEILGAIFFNKRWVVIDESLDSYYSPFKEFEFRYTLAHEVGHWLLHRPLFAKDPAQVFLFRRPPPPSVVRRRRHWERQSPGRDCYWSTQAAQGPIEWQADHFACCLLMPRHLLIAAWQERFGSSNPYIWRWKNLSPPAVANDHIATVFPVFDRHSDDEALDQLLLPFVKKFQVSMARMRIRLERLGFLCGSWSTLIHR
jgi:hypothetical protein